MAAVLVTGGTERAALATVRALGRAGHRCYVCAAWQRPLAGASRHCRGAAVVRDPLRDPPGFARDVATLVARWNVEVVIPITDACALALLPERERLGALVPFPDLARFRDVCDKAAVLELARQIGLAVPQQRRLEHADDWNRVVPIAYPVVVKPHRSVTEGASRTKLGVRHAAGPADLSAALAALPPEAYPVLVQQRIVGPGEGVFLLLWGGEVRAAFSHRRLREKPPAGGVSVYAESIAPDPELLRAAVELLRRCEWQGVAMVEFKRDAVTGTPYVMEVNGRLWGSLQLAIDAGVNFPVLLVAAALGRPAAPLADYQVGVRSRWWWGDVDHLLARLLHSSTKLARPPGAPGRLAAALAFLAASFDPRSRDAVFRLGDPLPALRETAAWLSATLGVAGRRSTTLS